MSRYFTLPELLASDTAKKKGIDNTPSFEVVEHLQDLADNLLDPLRQAWGAPIRVTSGYRSEKLNKAVGGVANSAHLTGYAADLQPSDRRKTARFILFANAWLLEKNIGFDQVIDERSGSERWLHLAIRSREGKQRRQFLKIDK